MSLRCLSEKGTRKDAAGAVKSANQAGRSAQLWCVEPREQGSRSALAGRRAILERVAPVTICTDLSEAHTRPSNIFSNSPPPIPSPIHPLLVNRAQRNIEARSLGRDKCYVDGASAHTALPINALLGQTLRGGRHDRHYIVVLAATQALVPSVLSSSCASRACTSTLVSLTVVS